jgi:hypothetical protein
MTPNDLLFRLKKQGGDLYIEAFIDLAARVPVHSSLPFLDTLRYSEALKKGQVPITKAERF